MIFSLGNTTSTFWISASKFLSMTVTLVLESVETSCKTSISLTEDVSISFELLGVIGGSNSVNSYSDLTI